MILWRISRHLELSGIGGLLGEGRWHEVGHPIVYLAPNPAAALLEVCVHTTADDLPPVYTLLRVFAPDDLAIPRIDLASLPDGWQDREPLTRDIGTAWLKSQRSALLKVPSAIVPETLNLLLNPLHPDAAKLAIVDARSYPFDSRLKF
jgi:RES domain-containing protein